MGTEGSPMTVFKRQVYTLTSLVEPANQSGTTPTCVVMISQIIFSLPFVGNESICFCSLEY
jgi:hypothetical protein